MLKWFIRFPEFAEFIESSAPFRENSNSSYLGCCMIRAAYFVLFTELVVTNQAVSVKIHGLKRHYNVFLNRRRKQNNVKNIDKTLYSRHAWKALMLLCKWSVQNLPFRNQHFSSFLLCWKKPVAWICQQIHLR